MNYIIYNPNSQGGNHKYAIHTAASLVKQGAAVTLLLPSNSQNHDQQLNYKPLLINDQPTTNSTILKKLHFFLRILLNPIIFFIYLIKQPSSRIIFNDFDQLTAILWAPLFKLLKKKHQFSILLHDPDRDAYPGGIKHTHRSMKAIMSLMDIAFYHEQLPHKVYYQAFAGKKISIPHGIYAPAQADTPLLTRLQAFKKDDILLCIPGNIRLEKNYTLIIKALQELPHCKLLIAGSPSSSAVKTEELKKLATQLNISDKIYWHTQYLSNEEFTSILEIADLILLYYKTTFTSQSGVLNQIAPLEKNVLISDTPSALTKLAQDFHLGTIVKADDKDAFIEGIHSALNNKHYKQHWDEYLKFACWKKQSELIIESFNIDCQANIK